jgi:hypothetical protein
MYQTEKADAADAIRFRSYDGTLSPLNRARASATRAWIAAFDHGHVGGSAGGGPTPAAHCSARSGIAAAIIAARFPEIA